MRQAHVGDGEPPRLASLLSNSFDTRDNERNSASETLTLTPGSSASRRSARDATPAFG
jgi:hypothetical protein